MKQLKFWLMSLAILCGCTNGIEEVEMNTSNELQTKAGLQEVTVTISFLIDQVTGTPPSLPSYAQFHCDVEPNVDFTSIQFPLYYIWQWDGNSWTEQFKTENFSFTEEGYLTGLPFLAGPNTAVCNQKVEVYPKSLESQYSFNYVFVGLTETDTEPTNEGGGTGGGLKPDPYDTFFKITPPIAIVKK